MKEKAAGCQKRGQSPYDAMNWRKLKFWEFGYDYPYPVTKCQSAIAACQFEVSQRVSSHPTDRKSLWIRGSSCVRFFDKRHQTGTWLTRDDVVGIKTISKGNSGADRPGGLGNLCRLSNASGPMRGFSGQARTARQVTCKMQLQRRASIELLAFWRER
jgi:hypothetical protein